MSDALDNWELADEDDIKAPVAILKSLKKMTITTPPTTTKSPSMPSSTSGSPSPISKGITPTILRRASDRSGQDNLGSEDTATGKSGGRSQHERNRELWNRANSYEQPIISRNDSHNIRTEYVPEIKILRRPKSPVQEVARATQSKSKSLAQREADYNAAREKIFGPSSTSSSTSNTNNSNTNLTSSRPNSRSSSTSRSGSSSPSPSFSNSGPKPGSPSLPGQNIRPIEFKGTSPSTRLAQRQSSSSSVTNDGNNVIRQPQGPVMNPQAANVQPRNSRQDKQEGSIGFRRSLKGANTLTSESSNEIERPK